MQSSATAKRKRSGDFAAVCNRQEPGAARRSLLAWEERLRAIVG